MENRLYDTVRLISRVICLTCGNKTNRQDLQEAIRKQNPHFHASPDIAAPDGDVLLSDDLIKDFKVPDCRNCGGYLNPMWCSSETMSHVTELNLCTNA